MKWVVVFVQRFSSVRRCWLFVGDSGWHIRGLHTIFIFEVEEGFDLLATSVNTVDGIDYLVWDNI